jgi:hypothetical protein
MVNPLGMRVRSSTLWATLVAIAMATPALAQEKPAKGVITLAEVTIVGRIQKPIAAVDVNRIQPKLTLQELRQPFLDKVERAIYQEPF